MSQQSINLTSQRNKVLIASSAFFKAEEKLCENNIKIMLECSDKIRDVYNDIYERYGINALCKFHNLVIDGAEAVLHRESIPIPKKLGDKMSECCQSVKKGTIYYGL